MPKAKNRLNEPWTDRDLRVMRQRAREGRSARETADELKRSRGAVAFKAMQEGVSFHAIRQPKGAQRKAQRTIARKRRAEERLAA